MNRKWFSIAALIAAATFLFSLPSCAYNQHLVSITVSPSGSSITLGGIGQDLPTQFTALGTYIHPPETKDITTTAVWSTDTPTIIFMDPKVPGLVHTTGTACGSNLGVSASVYNNPSNPPAGSVVVGSATVSVTFAAPLTCP
ncbi:MAG TPA: hypothetical protein VN310_07790 [Candidatus Dormibacteraeota bacterium]|jgi:hypothetical protein|nr:hypothetical protein [Candidatus Dormibacteraeota bacterium]